VPPRRAVTGRSQEPRKRLIEELVRLRAEKDIALRPLGERLGWDHSTLGKLESGESLGSPELLQALDDFYGTGALLLTLWELAIKDPTQFKEQYRRYMTLEADATSLWQYSPAVLPGLLQTADYAREALMAGGAKGEDLERQVDARLGRRGRLTADDAPYFRAIIAEGVLRTALLDTAAWREQLAYLAEMADRPTVAIQVLPSAAGLHALVSTDVMFLRLPEGRTVAYTENDHQGDLIEDCAPVEGLQLKYDRVRDKALSPDDSRKFIARILEDIGCDLVST
jgi:transcriptional regulator with XRE-family HTH domain